MAPLIPDSTTDARLAGLERFIESYLGPRRPEYGATEADVGSVAMPAPLQRFFRFAGRWPGHNPLTPYVNRFCIQDTLAGIVGKAYAPALREMDGRVVFVWENQGVWVAATERAGDDPPVWISEDCSHREARQVWRQLDNPLSHFLVSFALQELLHGSHVVAVAPAALEVFQQAGMPVVPAWIRGEYAWDIDRPSYYLAGGRFLVRRALDEDNGDDWYACIDPAGAGVLKALGLPSDIE
ncbi:MAG TPA: hypothetical protein VK986_07810 [Tepidisphaeraceae bacterium]|nr:hypothetical protein [Tepidisphaeraceae bacterium]